MHDSVKAKSYIPEVYKGFAEMEAIVDAGDSILDIAESELRTLIDNQYIVLAHEDGVREWEDMLSIVANPDTEDLEFRRQRIINRVSSRLPFTKISLKQKLDSVIGAGNYILRIENDTYTIYLESSASNQIWHSEIMLTMHNMKPCNMLFVNTPLIGSSIKAQETIAYSEKINNYTLGSGFQLGMRPFETYKDEVIIKLANTASIGSEFLSGIASSAASIVASVLINDSVSITSFTTKSGTGDTVTISYNVTAQQASEITSVKLLNSAGKVLSSAIVYVPVSASVAMKHTILFKEG